MLYMNVSINYVWFSYINNTIKGIQYWPMKFMNITI